MDVAVELKFPKPNGYTFLIIFSKPNTKHNEHDVTREIYQALWTFALTASPRRWARLPERLIKAGPNTVELLGVHIVFSQPINSGEYLEIYRSAELIAVGVSQIFFSADWLNFFNARMAEAANFGWIVQWNPRDWPVAEKSWLNNKKILLERNYILAREIAKKIIE